MILFLLLVIHVASPIHIGTNKSQDQIENGNPNVLTKNKLLQENESAIDDLKIKGENKIIESHRKVSNKSQDQIKPSQTYEKKMTGTEQPRKELSHELPIIHDQEENGKKMSMSTKINKQATDELQKNTRNESLHIGNKSQDQIETAKSNQFTNNKMQQNNEPLLEHFKINAYIKKFSIQLQNQINELLGSIGYLKYIIQILQDSLERNAETNQQIANVTNEIQNDQPINDVMKVISDINDAIRLLKLKIQHLKMSSNESDIEQINGEQDVRQDINDIKEYINTIENRLQIDEKQIRDNEEIALINIEIQQNETNKIKQDFMKLQGNITIEFTELNETLQHINEVLQAQINSNNAANKEQIHAVEENIASQLQESNDNKTKMDLTWFATIAIWIGGITLGGTLLIVFIYIGLNWIERRKTSQE